MENKKETVQKGIEKASHGLEKTVETIGDTIIAVMDKLAGKKSDIKLSFEDLTIETGPMKAKINGSIVLDIVYASDAELSP
jgi:endonuclease IV